MAAIWERTEGGEGHAASLISPKKGKTYSCCASDTQHMKRPRGRFWLVTNTVMMTFIIFSVCPLISYPYLYNTIIQKILVKMATSNGML